MQTRIEFLDKNRLLIVGIDPGTTVGYAVINCAGEYVNVGSSKMLDLDLVVSRIAPLGKVLFVGTDKAKVPDFVERFATKVGARVVSPEMDLRREEKGALVYEEKHLLKNGHEADALACARFTHKQVWPLLLRIENFCKETRQEHMHERIIELVVKKQMSIHAAAEVLQEKPKSIDQSKVRVRSDRSENVFELKRRFEDVQDAYEQVLEENEKLQKMLRHSEGRIFEYQHGEKRVKNRDKLLQEKEQRIFNLNKEVKKKTGSSCVLPEESR